MSLLLACSSDPVPDPPSSSPTGAAGAEIQCEESIDDAPPGPDADVIGDAVSLLTNDHPVLQTVPDGDRWWAKQGITIRRGQPVTLSVSQESVDDLRIGWGFAPITSGTTVTANCAGTGWLSFPGGYWVRQPGCYSVEVRIDGQAAERIAVGIGAPCTGQAPPTSR